MRGVGAGFEARLAADAFIGIGHANITIFGADMAGSGRAIIDTQGSGALAANGDLDVVRVAGKYGSADLDASQRGAGFALMDERAGEHATLAAGAEPAVVNDIACRQRVIGFCGCGGGSGLGSRSHAKSSAGNCNAAADNEVASRVSFALISFVFFH
jgi:hypothetical protein